MAVVGGPNLVKDGLILYLDASNTESYPGSGSTWYDLSGSGNNATKAGSQSPTYPQYNSAGYFTFSGGVLGTNYSRFEVTTATYSAITVLTFHYSTESGGHVLRNSSDSFQIGPDGYAAGTAYNNINCSRTDTLNSWVCDALSFSGTQLYGYRNGLQVSSASRASTTIAGGTLNIGSRNDNYAAHYFGNIALVQIYNRVLSSTEILQNYNALKSRFGL